MAETSRVKRWGAARFRAALLLPAHLGWNWLFGRLLYWLKRKSGFLRRSTPPVAWSTLRVPALRRRRLVSAGGGTKGWATHAAAEAEAILAGRYRLFSHRVVAAGLPPDWHRNQLTGESAPPRQHWTSLGDFDFGDIKGIWELSRFGWAFALVRANARTADSRYEQAFWRLLEDWLRHNPPNCGVNWRCGQEATFRLMAVIFSAETLGMTEQQRVMVARLAIASGRRIEANLGYALSQKNNHGVSECVGLITVALWLEPDADSARWLRRGEKELAGQLSELVYPDGSFAQHSLIYHRVLLHDLAWVATRYRAAGGEPPAWLLEAARRALDFLVTITDPATGLAPLFGTNDGTNILPLADGDFLDMRPAIQAASAVFNNELPLPEGPWDEAAAWLHEALQEVPRVPWPRRPLRWHARQGGYAQLAIGGDRLFLRCPEAFRHRPSQADLLHVDVWLQGQPIAQDGGSYSYNSTERFVALADAAQHNTLTIGGLEPIQKFSRFLYLPWPQGEVGDSGGGGIRASHDGYAKVGGSWSREVRVRGRGGFEVADCVRAPGRVLRWHWLLGDLPWRVEGNSARVDAGDSSWTIRWHGLEGFDAVLQRACPVTAEGWRSQYYSEVEPACSLIISGKTLAEANATFEFFMER